jgi:hypothetical protein
LAREYLSHAAGGVEGEGQRNALRARREIFKANRVPVIAHREICLRESVDALPARVLHDNGHGHEVRADAQNFLVMTARAILREES